MAIINELNKTGKEVTRKVEKTLKDSLKKGQVKSKKIINGALKSLSKNSKQLENSVGEFLDNAQGKFDTIQTKLKTKLNKLDKSVSKASSKAVKEIKAVKKDIQNSKPVKDTLEMVTAKTATKTGSGASKGKPIKAISQKSSSKPSISKAVTKITKDNKVNKAVSKAVPKKASSKTSKLSLPALKSGAKTQTKKQEPKTNVKTSVKKPSLVAAKKAPSK